MERRELVIIGAGPAGLTAAIYGARAGLSPLVLAGSQPLGQLMLTSLVENFPGFPEGIEGPQLMEQMRAQAERVGATIVFEEATEVDFSIRPFTIHAGDRTVQADAVIVATGASARWLGLPSETRLRGHGVSACATCDGAFFRNKVAAVVGGGDVALEDALVMTKFATKVYLIHRRNQFRGSKAMSERVLAHEKIEVVWDSVVDEILGDKAVTGVRLKNTVSGEMRTLDLSAVFIAIGHVPYTGIFTGKLELTEANYIATKDGMMTSIEGVFYAGDAADSVYRQATSAVGDGCRAAIAASRWLETRGRSQR
jgi:thioredoxin reductase (NADPH)